MKLSNFKQNISYTENILVVEKNLFHLKGTYMIVNNTLVISNDQLISMPPALICRIVSSFLYGREETDTRIVMLRFFKIPGDLYYLGVEHSRHQSITNPNFYKPSDSRSPKSVSNALTKHWKGSLGLQD